MAIIRKLLFTAAVLALMALLTHSTVPDEAEAQAGYAASWAVFGGACALMGIIEPRFWILLLAPLTWLVVWVPGFSAEERAYALLFGVPALLLGLLVGLAAGRALRAAMKR